MISARMVSQKLCGACETPGPTQSGAPRCPDRQTAFTISDSGTMGMRGGTDNSVFCSRGF